MRGEYGSRSDGHKNLWIGEVHTHYDEVVEVEVGKSQCQVVDLALLNKPCIGTKLERTVPETAP